MYSSAPKSITGSAHLRQLQAANAAKSSASASGPASAPTTLSTRPSPRDLTERALTTRAASTP